MFLGTLIGKCAQASAFLNCPSNILRSFGEIIAVSLAQGGPPPDFMRNWCYTYLTTGDLDRLAVTPEDVTDLEIIQLVEKVLQLSVQC